MFTDYSGILHRYDNFSYMLPATESLDRIDCVRNFVWAVDYGFYFPGFE